MSEHSSTITHWQVQGMTCGHCVASVTEELTELPGVETVDVQLESGQVTISSTRELDREAVAAAVTEAGYALA